MMHNPSVHASQEISKQLHVSWKTTVPIEEAVLMN